MFKINFALILNRENHPYEVCEVISLPVSIIQLYFNVQGTLYSSLMHGES